MIDALLIGGMLCFWILTPIFVIVRYGWLSDGIWWVAWWVWLGLNLAAFEFVSWLTTKRTLTQHLRKWGKESKTNTWIVRGILLAWSLGWILLMVHLWV